MVTTHPPSSIWNPLEHSLQVFSSEHSSQLLGQDVQVVLVLIKNPVSQSVQLVAFEQTEQLATQAVHLSPASGSTKYLLSQTWQVSTLLQVLQLAVHVPQAPGEGGITK